MVKGGRFFRLSLPSPSVRRGSAGAWGCYASPAIRHGRGRGDEKRGADNFVRTPLAYPVFPFALNKTAGYFVEFIL